jgi:hypothetical protein
LFLASPGAEIIADKLSAAGLVVGLLQRRYPRWLAMDRRRPSRRSPLYCALRRTARFVPNGYGSLNSPPARVSRSRCSLHRKRESQRHVEGRTRFDASSCPSGLCCSGRRARQIVQIMPCAISDHVGTASDDVSKSGEQS